MTLKVRHGHVSNSSTSSFIVEYEPWLLSRDSKEPLLTPNQIEVLETLGFKRTYTMCPHRVESDHGHIEEHPEGMSFALFWPINHDEIFRPLIEAHIPFHGTCHHGHWDTFYDGTSDFIWFVRNMGKEIIQRLDTKEMEQEIFNSLSQVFVRQDSIYDYVPEPEEI